MGGEWGIVCAKSVAKKTPFQTGDKEPSHADTSKSNTEASQASPNPGLEVGFEDS